MRLHDRAQTRDRPKVKMDWLLGWWAGMDAFPRSPAYRMGGYADKLGVFVSSAHSISGRSIEMVEQKIDFGRLSISEIRAKTEASFSRRFTCDVLSEVRPVHVRVTDVDSGERIPHDANTSLGQKLYLTILLQKEREYQELVVRGLDEARRRLKRPAGGVVAGCATAGRFRRGKIAPFRKRRTALVVHCVL